MKLLNPNTFEVAAHGLDKGSILVNNQYAVAVHNSIIKLR